MKNLFKRSIATAVALTFVLTSLSSFANHDNDPEKLAFTVNAVKNSNKIAIGVRQAQSGKLSIKIFDEAGNHLYTDHFNNTKGLIRTYDLTNSGPGNYTVKISSPEASGERQVTLGENAEKIPFKAYFSSYFKDNKIKVSYYNAFEPAQVVVSLPNGQTVFESTISNDKDHSSIINLSSLDEGNYLVRIESDGQGIEKEVTVK